MHSHLKLTGVAAAVMSALYGTQACATDELMLEEVVVTATRHSANAQDIPLSITAITGSTLEAAGIGSLSELAHSMAGVNVTDKGPFGGVNGSSVIIRGMNSESTAGEFILAFPIVQPVATYVDDTPLFVNLRLQDLDRVEILRGPQGTLYGSGSLGGTIRFVQNAPDPKGFDARLDVGVSKTSHTHTANEDINGMLNLPVSDTFALRLNAGYTGTAGFINQSSLYALDSSGAPILAQPGNVLTSPPATYSKDGTNSYQYKSARIAALWRPNDDFHAQLSYYYQLANADGFPYASPRLGLDNLASTDVYPAAITNRVDVAALTLGYDLGFATLSSNSSWGRSQNQGHADITPLYDNFSFYQSFYGQNPRVFVDGAQAYDDKSWAQEFRLASKSGGATEWVGGLFYKSENTSIQEHDFYPGYFDYFNACFAKYGAAGVGPLDGVTPSQCGGGEFYAPGAANIIDGIPLVKDQAYVGDFQTHFTDLALFGEYTWHVATDWSVTGGGRLFRQSVSQSQQTGLLFDGPSYIANESQSASWRKAQWKLNTSYQLDAKNLVYATWSQGFRRGAVNALPPKESAYNYVTPPGLYKVAPDTADNYEIGIKGTIENRFRYSAAIFDIQWHNVQEGAFLTPLVLPGSINVGEATSKGLETELYLLVTSHLSVQFDYTYDKTKLTALSPLAQLPAPQGLSVQPPGPGAPLPGTPENTAALSFEYGHIEVAGGELRFAANAHYQSSVVPALSATSPPVPSYTVVGARVGYSRPHWTTTLYVDNLTNNLGISAYSDPTNYGKDYQAVVSPPRTIGIKVAYSFKE